MASISRRNFLAGSASAVALAGLAACGGQGASESTSSASGASSSASSSEGYTLVTPGKLTVVSELGFSPFEYIDDDGNTVGFDVDVSKALAEKLGLEAEWLPNQAFDTLVPTIKQGGKADVAIAGMTITDERLEQVDFTDAYLDSNQGLVVGKDSGETEETLNDASKQVACQSGTTGEMWIQENLPNATLVPLQDVTAGMMGVQTGLYNGMVIDLPVAQNLIAESFTDLTVALEIPTGEQYGIAVSKDNPGLKDALNDALQAIQDDGTMDGIKQTWFGTTEI